MKLVGPSGQPIKSDEKILEEATAELEASQAEPEVAPEDTDEGCEKLEWIQTLKYQVPRFPIGRSSLIQRRWFDAIEKAFIDHARTMAQACAKDLILREKN